MAGHIQTMGQLQIMGHIQTVGHVQTEGHVHTAGHVLTWDMLVESAMQEQDVAFVLHLDSGQRVCQL